MDAILAKQQQQRMETFALQSHRHTSPPPLGQTHAIYKAKTSSAISFVSAIAFTFANARTALTGQQAARAVRQTSSQAIETPRLLHNNAQCSSIKVHKQEKFTADSRQHLHVGRALKRDAAAVGCRLLVVG
ncbi:unnamed protein product [Ceratitis capitata]|uniref:(Mediterranean fruit fly) hypothetical protein n=1 Tax=Ceratitis capitata TaxID=7213 RepID=A0A811VAI1_CERCA|nr:unnamed protein product [Ceratitis capitata]